VLSDSPSLSDMSAKNYIGNGGRTSTPNNNNQNTSYLAKRRSSTSITAREANRIRRQIEDLEKMYQEILKLIEADRTCQGINGVSGGIDSWQTKSSTGIQSSTTVSSFTSSIKNDQLNSNTYNNHNRNHDSNHQHFNNNHKNDKYLTKHDHKQTNYRFNRLENHVINLAKTVAHISSEVQSIKSIEEELYSLRKDFNVLKTNNNLSTRSQSDSNLLLLNNNNNNNNNIKSRIPQSQQNIAKFHCWMTEFSNPKRLKKLTK
jgi:prefoldin subunit 5